jgi:Na+-transporting NADH:ubiquinone oxidoreductase subunit NqrF
VKREAGRVRVRYLTVTVRGQDKPIKTPPEPSQNLRELLLRHKQPLYKGWAKFPVFMPPLPIGNCHGHGICGACMVRVVDNPAGLTDRTPAEVRRLGPTSPQSRLACQAWVCGDVTLDLRKTSLSDEAGLLAEAESARADHKAAFAGE